VGVLTAESAARGCKGVSSKQWELGTLGGISIAISVCCLSAALYF
jgi:hypothetical protein